MFNIKIYKSALLSLIRNRWLTFATIVVMTLTLFTVSVFVVLSVLINSTVDTVKSRIDLEVYFKSEASEDQILDIRRSVLKMPEVRDAEYISKEQAFEIFKERNKNNPELYETISDDDNPLPASLRVDLNRAEDLDKLNQVFKKGEYAPLVEDTSYESNRNVVESLILFGGYVTKAGVGMSLLFILTSLIVVLNTIRMTVYTRRDEIEIMRLVGATNWYIRWPFILEGAFYGFFSMIIASAAVFIGLKVANPSISGYLGEFSDNFYSSLAANGVLILGWQLGISIFVGVVSAYIAISRYLKT